MLCQGHFQIFSGEPGVFARKAFGSRSLSVRNRFNNRVMMLLRNGQELDPPRHNHRLRAREGNRLYPLGGPAQHRALCQIKKGSVELSVQLGISRQFVGRRHTTGNQNIRFRNLIDLRIDPTDCREFVRVRQSFCGQLYGRAFEQTPGIYGIPNVSNSEFADHKAAVGAEAFEKTLLCQAFESNPDRCSRYSELFGEWDFENPLSGPKLTTQYFLAHIHQCTPQLGFDTDSGLLRLLNWGSQACSISLYAPLFSIRGAKCRPLGYASEFLACIDSPGNASSACV